MSSLYDSTYNPDVLSCIANLSNDEVFTPPDVANAMLDMLPQELFESPDTTFLDPACKSGVFLREIAKRLLVGLEDKIPDLQERVDHIFQKQLYGIAITELTSLLSRRSLYCSKYPNSVYSVTQFDDIQGNIRFKNIKHTFLNGKCVYCGASEEVFGNEVRENLEFHAYEFIHTLKPEEIWNMKFDVIIGNPPYQLNTAGDENGGQAKPIYQKFVEQAIKLKPRYLTMITPSRWFAGGWGLDDFRKYMISCNHIVELHDFQNSVDCFSGVEIKGGVSYFLWSRDDSKECHVVSHNADKISESYRFLMEVGVDSFIRWNEGVDILHKVRKLNEKTVDILASSQRPFGLPTNVIGNDSKGKNDIDLYIRGAKKVYISRHKITKGKDVIDKYKIFISKAYNGGDNFPHQILGKPIIASIPSCCSETYIYLGPFNSENEANNFASYACTKFFRFLVALKKISQDALQKVYSLVPLQDFSKPWTDEELYAKYGLSDEEIEFIESMIKPMELD